MKSSRHSPYPVPPSAPGSESDYSPEPSIAPSKRRSRSALTAEERREARAHRNRLAAQSSRDRKKLQFEQLSTRVAQLEDENRALRLGVAPSSVESASASLADENAQLRARIQQLELAWQNLTKILGSLPLQVPGTSIQQPPALSPRLPTSSALKLSLPLSPATTSVTTSDIGDHLSEPTRESARFANASLEACLQRVAPAARSSMLRFLSEQEGWSSNQRPNLPRCVPLQSQLTMESSNPICC